jgi:chaperonin GroES
LDKETHRKEQRKHALRGVSWENGREEDEQATKFDYNPIEGESFADDMNALAQTHNVALSLDRETLDELGAICGEGFERDLKTRSDWENCIDEWTELAMQTRETRSYPWHNASNVKYPMLSTAAMQFAARAYPSLVPSNGDVVKTTIIGKDPTGEKFEKASRVSKFMSYQVMCDIPGWEEDMDKLLLMLSIVGCMFKKTYFDPADKKIKSKLLLPKAVVVNNWATCLEEAERVSEVFFLSPRLVEERKRQGLYLNRALGSAPTPTSAEATPGQDETTPFEIVEQHCFADLDDDGYAEPYIVTFQRHSNMVLRVTPRWEEENIVKHGDDIISIKPTNYYTKFTFVPNPDGGFYGIGFGALLGPLNEAVNTLINQLVDSGSLANLQGGFIAKGLRLRMGETRFQPGEWKPVNATGQSLKEGIFPLPAKDPSNVLFQLMGSLITSGKELASVAEIFTGKMPGQNTPATTTMASIEQGMKVFTAVYKRIYRSLAEEFNKIYDLNHTYLNPETYAEIVDVAVGPEDFTRKGYDIVPGADPNAASSAEKIQKVQMLGQMLQEFGPLMNPVEVITRMLDAQEQPNPEKLLAPQVLQTGQPPPPPPDPKMMAIQAKVEADKQKASTDMQVAQHDAAIKERGAQVELAMKAENQHLESQGRQQKIVDQAREAATKQAIFTADAANKMRQNEATHQQSMQLAKEKAKSQPTSKKKTS